MSMTGNCDTTTEQEGEEWLRQTIVLEVRINYVSANTTGSVKLINCLMARNKTVAIPFAMLLSVERGWQDTHLFSLLAA